MKELIYLLPEVLKNVDSDERLYETLIFALWNRAVGVDLALRSAPVGFRSGVLTIATPSDAWRYQLSGLGSEIIERINTYLAQKAVNEIVFIIDSTFPDKGQGTEDLNNRTGAKKELLLSPISEAETIPDRELRDLFKRTVSRNLDLQKQI